MACNKNEITLFDLDFSAVSDEGNWNTNASNIISSVGGKIRLIPDDDTTFFERTFNTIDNNNNRIRIGIDFQVFRPIDSLDLDSTVFFELFNGTELIGSGTACLTGIEAGLKADFHLDRTFVYDGTIGSNMKLKITVPAGFGNYVELKDMEITDFNFCDDDIRTYFVFDDFFETSRDSKSGIIDLKEWKVDGSETLTTEFFAENNGSIIDATGNWLYADADIDGDNRVQDEDSPKSFNPFVKLWNLEFANPVPYYGGKPTGTGSGSDYGPGILTFGLGKPQVLNANLEPKDGAIFIDIDYTKDLRIVIDFVLSPVSNQPYTNSTYYRRYYIIWNSVTCQGEFYYEDFLNSKVVVNEIHNGFLYGITDQEIEPNVVACMPTPYSGASGLYQFQLNFGTGTGQAGIDFNVQGFSAPVKFIIEWNGQTVTTGYVGTDVYDQELINLGISPSEINTGTPPTGVGNLSFNKNLADPNNATVTVVAPIQRRTSWSFTGVCPEDQDSVEIGLGDCDTAPTSWSEVYVNTPNVLTYIPFDGDIVYSDTLLTTPFNGNDNRYQMRIPNFPFPIVLDYSFQISATGEIFNRLGCVTLPSGTEITIDNFESNGCYSCWTITVNVPPSETREVQFISQFAPGGLYGSASCTPTGTVISSDQTVNISSTTQFTFGIDGATSGIGDLPSIISVLVTDGPAIIDNQQFSRDHANNNC